MVPSDRIRSDRHGRVLGAFLAFALTCALLVGLPATALGLDTASRSAAQIQTRWSQLKPAYSGSPFTIAPGTTAPYSAGMLAPGFLQDGLKAINYARFLAGLPDDVVLDSGYVDGAQHGAVLLAASTFSHTPPKPADMDQAFFDLGYAATSRSNIGWGYGTLSAFNFGCMDDSDSTNIDRLGHRRWLLDPPLLKTGMGFASSRSDTFVFDWSRTAAVDYDSIKWPSEGYFPVEMFATQTAWSVTLDPAKYSWMTGTPGHTVTLRRVADGRTWTFTSADTDKGGKYFNFETSGYGVADCFVFRPDAATLGSYKSGDAFDVTISGGITRKSTGQPATISYRTTFMSQVAQSGPPPVTPPGTPPAVPKPVYRFYNVRAGVHFYTISEAEKANVIATLGAVYRYEGPSYWVNTASPYNNTPLYRFYNRRTGTHFYTASATERANVIATLGAVYNYEGPAYSVCAGAVAGATPVYRFYNRLTGTHFYTASEAERANVIATLGAVYNFEGPAFYLAP